MRQKSYNDTASLYLIPTPIGNLEDITIRSLNVLNTVDVILSEDTRETMKLLKHYDISKKLISSHQWNESKIVDQVIDYLKSGQNIGLVTDQGTPIISDPGYIISKAVIASGYNVISLPGATAFVPAITSSGIDPSPFLYYGFLNSHNSKQKTELKSLKNIKYTLVFYESVHRLKNTLENMLEIFGDRFIAISREISKLHEEVIRDNISNVIPIADMLKGEFVIVVEGNKEIIDYSTITILEHVNLYVKDGMSEMDAIKSVAKDRGISKGIVYKEYHIGK